MSKKWTYEEDVFILKNHKHMTSLELSKYLNRSASAIRSRMINYLHVNEKKSNLNKWFKEQAPKLTPEEAIDKLKRFKVKYPEKVYKDWRNKYMKARSI